MRGGTARINQGAKLLDSAPSDSSDDSGQVLTWPPSHLGGAAGGDFGGNVLLHLSHRLPKLLGTSARLLLASAPLPRRTQHSILTRAGSNHPFAEPAPAQLQPVWL